MADALFSLATATLTEFTNDPTTPSAWPGIPKLDVYFGLLERVLDRDKIDQQQSPYCGPVAFWRTLLQDDPVAYVDAALTLYQTGRAEIGRLVIEPSSAVLNSPPKWGLAAVDWITLGGLRDSENSLFSAAGWFGDSIAGITIPTALAEWFRKAGYSEVKNHASVNHGLLRKWELWQHAQQAGAHQKQGYRVAMFVDSDVLITSNQEDTTSAFPDHWIMLESAVGPAIPYREQDKVKAVVFTWGETRTLAENFSKPVSEAGFVTKYYGYVAVKR